MNKKFIIILLLLVACILLAGPVAAKEKVKIKITSQDSVTDNKAYIVIKITDKKGHEITSDARINLTVTDKNGNYYWVCKSYGHGVKLKYDVGKYKVKVKFFGDSHYKKAKKTKKIALTSFDPYSYYDSHNYGDNSQIDDYMGYSYWVEEIYDDVDDPENEAWDL